MPASHEADAAQLRGLLDSLADTLRAKDLDGLRHVYAADVISFDVEPPLQHAGIEAKLANWTRAFGFFDELDYEIRDLAVVAGDDVAFGHCFGRLSGTLRDGTATRGMWVRATFGFRKADGAWRIVHDQVSVPFDIATGKGVVDLEP